MREHIATALGKARNALDALLHDDHQIARIAVAGDVLVRALRGEGRAFSCGNGGSMSDAMHFAEELTGRYRRDRRALPAMAIADPAHLSCTANDFGYKNVFARFLEAYGRAGDALLAISTSGRSANVLRAAEVARTRDMSVIALVGVADSPLSGLASGLLRSARRAGSSPTECTSCTSRSSTSSSRLSSGRCSRRTTASVRRLANS
jgi:D-sedoheptulose 7-phosphate isomerase